METIGYIGELDLLDVPTSQEFSVVTIPAHRYLMIDAHLTIEGQVNPGARNDFQASTDALFSVAYALKNMCEKAVGRSYLMPPLESLWWVETKDDAPSGRGENWEYTSMIMVPDWIDEHMIRKAVKSVMSREPNPKLAEIRIDTLKEGRSVQILFSGALGDETPTIDRLRREYIPEHGYSCNGKHHEIYLCDPYCMGLDNFCMIIRQPVMEFQG